MQGIFEKHVRSFYRLLAHTNETEIRALRKGYPPIITFIGSEEEFLRAVERLNSDRNVYAVLREKQKGLRRASRSEDIVSVGLTVIDIDPVRERYKQSSEGELLSAIEVSQLISEWFRQHGFQKPVAAISGNGVHLYFFFPPVAVSDSNRQEIQDYLQFFESEVRRMFAYDLERYRCRIDSMYDLPRIGKVIGSRVFSSNPEDSSFKMSCFIDEYPLRRDDPLLLKAILSKSITETHLHSIAAKPISPIWLMQPIPYFGEKLQGEWIVEPKIDGWRLQVIRNARSSVFFGRRLERNPNWTEKLLNTVGKEAVEKIPDGTLIDCELFTDMGRRFIPSVLSKNPKAKPMIYVFDVVYFGGSFVGDLPLKERKRILKSLELIEPFREVEYQPLTDVEEALRQAIQRGYEGVLLKDLSSPYAVGREAPVATLSWRKLKPGRTVWQLEDFR